MLVSINSALSSLDASLHHIDFEGIQRIVNTLSDIKTRDAAKADPHNYMINEMKKNNLPIPDGLHFHFRQGTTLVPPEADDVVTPPSTLVLAAAPNKPFELELFQMGGTASLAGVGLFPCRGCQICIIVVEV
jgi:hypothetical protein